MVLFNSIPILRQDIFIVPVSGIPSTTETGGSGSAATKAKVNSEGAPTARILGSALYPPSGGVPDNLPLVTQTHWPTTGYHKNQYSSYYPHDPAYWYRLAGKLLKTSVKFIFFYEFTIKICSQSFFLRPHKSRA